jgi:hypothetical protein
VSLFLSPYKNDDHIALSRFSYFHKLVKITVKFDRQQWLKSVDDRLNNQHSYFWKYVSNFTRKEKLYSIANLCYKWFIQLNFPCNYNSLLNYLNVKTLYSRLHHLDVLFLINVFKGKINFCSIMDIIGPCVATMQIRDFCSFKVTQGVSQLQTPFADF